MLPHTKHAAYKKIIELLNSAKKSIIIIDPYFDDNTLQIIDEIPKNLNDYPLSRHLKKTSCYDEEMSEYLEGIFFMAKKGQQFRQYTEELAGGGKSLCGGIF